MVDSVENVVNSNAGLVSGLSALFIYTSLNEDAIPVVVGLLVDGVGTADITLWCITNKVYSLGGPGDTVLSLAPLVHEAGSKLKGGNLGLAKGVGKELALAASEVLEGNLEHAAEGTHTETYMLVGS